MKTSLKNWPKVYRRLKSVAGMTFEERIRFARSQAATPEERWEMNVNCIKVLGFGGRVRSLADLERRKAKLRRLESPSLWRLRISNEERAAGRMLGDAALKEVR